MDLISAALSASNDQTPSSNKKALEMPQLIVPAAPESPQPANPTDVTPSSADVTESEVPTTVASTKLQENTEIASCNSSAFPLPAGPSPIAVSEQVSRVEETDVEAARNVAATETKAPAVGSDEGLGTETTKNPSAGGILAMIRADQALQATDTTNVVPSAVPGALPVHSPTTRTSPNKPVRRSDDVPTRGAAQVHQEVRRIIDESPVGGLRPMSAGAMVDLLMSDCNVVEVLAKRLYSQIRKGAPLHRDWHQAFAQGRFKQVSGRSRDPLEGLPGSLSAAASASLGGSGAELAQLAPCPSQRGQPSSRRLHSQRSRSAGAAAAAAAAGGSAAPSAAGAFPYAHLLQGVNFSSGDASTSSSGSSSTSSSSAGPTATTATESQQGSNAAAIDAKGVGSTVPLPSGPMPPGPIPTGPWSAAALLNGRGGQQPPPLPMPQLPMPPLPWPGPPQMQPNGAPPPPKPLRPAFPPGTSARGTTTSGTSSSSSSDSNNGMDSSSGSNVPPSLLGASASHFFNPALNPAMLAAGAAASGGGGAGTSAEAQLAYARGYYAGFEQARRGALHALAHATQQQQQQQPQPQLQQGAQPQAQTAQPQPPLDGTAGSPLELPLQPPPFILPANTSELAPPVTDASTSTADTSSAALSSTAANPVATAAVATSTSDVGVSTHSESVVAAQEKSEQDSLHVPDLPPDNTPGDDQAAAVPASAGSGAHAPTDTKKRGHEDNESSRGSESTGQSKSARVEETSRTGFLGDAKNSWV